MRSMNAPGHTKFIPYKTTTKTKKVKQVPMTNERFSEVFNEETMAKFYSLGLVSNILYSLAFDLNKYIERKHCTLHHESKQWYNKLKKNIVEQEKILHRLADSYADGMDGEKQDLYLNLTDIWECYVRNLLDKLASSGYFVENYEKIWNAMQTCETKNIIDFEDPDFSVLSKDEEESTTNTQNTESNENNKD